MGIDYIKPLEALIYKYSKLLFTGLSTGCLALFTAFFTCWFLWHIIWKGAVKGESHFEDLVRPLITYTLITFFLNVNHFFDWIYDPILKTTTLLLKDLMTILELEGHSNSYTIWGMMETVDTALSDLYRLTHALLNDGSFFGAISGTVSGVILLMPFVFLWAIFICFAFDYMFKLLAVSALSPLLIVFGGFSKTRYLPLMGLKMAMHGIVTLFVSVIGMGLAVIAIKTALTTGIPVEGVVFKATAGSFAFSKEYWGCFVVACVAIYFQLKAPAIAGIVGTSDGVGSAGFVAGAITTAYAYGQQYGKSGLRATGSFMKHRAVNPILDKIRGG